ncbi:MAG TPA: tetratricopeptide repeat protein, partial [Pyrinomonadaceae bacterium]|nr:tetratricopeptide repeat protein [Pyrinomonadaceae bacterium]
MLRKRRSIEAIIVPGSRPQFAISDGRVLSALLCLCCAVSVASAHNGVGKLGAVKPPGRAVDGSVNPGVAFWSMYTRGSRGVPGQKPKAGYDGDSQQREIALLVQAGKLAEAEALARDAVTAEPRDARRRALLGAILDQLGRALEAEREYREALRFDPRSPVALTNLGVLLARTNRSDEAIKAFEKALVV